MIRHLFPVFVVLACSVAASADDYAVEPLEDAAPADALSKEIAAELSPTGFTIKRSETSTLCNVWFCKQWPVKAGFSPTLSVLYPFEPGQLIGVVQFKRSSEDFREQDIDRGVYTLRYALQPVDGNHVGTSPTRDFLLVVDAETDKSAKPLDIEKLHAVSAEAVETSHPGLLLMQPVPKDADASKASIQENDDEWQIVRLPGTGVANGKKSPQLIELVIVGSGDE